MNHFVCLLHPYLIIYSIKFYWKNQIFYIQSDLWIIDQIVEQKHMSESKAALIFKQIIQAILYWNKN